MMMNILKGFEMNDRIKSMLQKLAYEIKEFMKAKRITENSMIWLLEITSEEFELILRAEMDLKLSKLIEISLKIGRDPRIYFSKGDFSNT